MLGKKTGGRQKGTPNKRKELHELLEAVFARVDPVEKIVSLLTSQKDAATEARVLLRLLEYAYGPPPQEFIMEERKPIESNTNFFDAKDASGMGRPN